MKKCILLIEDTEDTRAMLHKLLEYCLNMEVDVAEDGAEGLRMLMEKQYSLVVTDLQMPNMTGMQLLEEIQNRHWPVPVIVTTGNESIHDGIQAMQLGAYDLLTKPVDLDQLIATIKRALKECQHHEECVAR